MSRAQFLRTAGVGAAAVGAATMGMSGTAHATTNAPADAVPIYPIGNPAPIATYIHPYLSFLNGFPVPVPCTPDTAQLVAAFQNGGKFLLKAVNQDNVKTPFELGTFPLEMWFMRGMLALYANTEIYGETFANYMTTLKGGFSVLHTFNTINLVVDGIHFDYPMLAAITPHNFTGLTLTNNVVTNVVGFPLTYYNGVAYPIKNGFVGISGGGVPGNGPMLGTVTIQNNHIDIGPNEPTDISSGITVLDLSLSYGKGNADVDISGNHIYNVRNTGIWLGGMQQRGYVFDNYIECAPVGNIPPELAVNGGGIFIDDPVDVIQNEVVGWDGWGAITLGVLLLPGYWHGYAPDFLQVDGSKVEGNTISMKQDGTAHILLLKGTDVEVTGNILKNRSGATNQMGIYLAKEAYGNYIHDNDFTQTYFPGWTDPIRPSGCIYLESGSRKNQIFENIDVCQQILGIQGNLVENDIGGWNPGLCKAYESVYPGAIEKVTQNMLKLKGGWHDDWENIEVPAEFQNQ